MIIGHQRDRMMQILFDVVDRSSPFCRSGLIRRASRNILEVIKGFWPTTRNTEISLLCPCFDKTGGISLLPRTSFRAPQHCVLRLPRGQELEIP